MSARHRFNVRFQRALRHMTPLHIARTRITKRAIMNFAEKVGLVYFGYVDQRDDEHRLIRGHTVSETHQDNHYCVGTVHGYDCMMVLRNDTISPPGNSHASKRCHWLIVTVDVHTKSDIPHCYIGHQNRDHAFRASYEPLNHLALGSLHQYSPHFLSEYTVYAQATHAVEIERILTPQVSQVISEHFSGASIEIEDNTVFLYIESPRPTEAVLEKMLSNGLWLAECIDATYETSTSEQ